MWVFSDDISHNSNPKYLVIMAHVSGMEKPYRDRETLVELYHEEDLTTAEIGERFGVSKTPIQTAMNDLDVDTQKPRDKDLLKDLRRVANNGQAPSQSEYREHGEYGQGTIQRRFDGWNVAMEEAGLVANEASDHTDQELLDALESLSDELGRTPTQNEVREKCEYSVGAYYNHFGSLNDAKEMLGLDLNKEQNVDLVQTECANCSAELQLYPSDYEVSEHNYCSQECHYEHNQERYSGDGNPRSTLVEVDCSNCGETLQRPHWKRENNKRHFCDYQCMGNWYGENLTGEDSPNWKRFPTKECKWCGKSYKIKPSEKDRSNFCSMECRDDWKAEAFQGSNNPAYAGGRLTNMGANWEEQRVKAIMRGLGRCQDCGMPENDHVNVFGEGLSVHHIVPRKEFMDGGVFDYENGNDIDNLRPLCRPCHGTYD